ncbi:hypothetical protein NEPAR08_1809 [Nematocida parisii]|nr:hypothetical protein NEPAR08_1809 [Nematocida parisii]
MAVSKRRISQKCRKSADDECPSSAEEEIRFDPNKKILRAKRRNERAPGPRASLFGKPAAKQYTTEQKLKGLNQSFIESVSKAYNIDNTYNFTEISNEYTTYREGIVGSSEHSKNTTPLSSEQKKDISNILRAGLGSSAQAPAQPDESQMKMAQFILGQHGGANNNLFGSIGGGNTSGLFGMNNNESPMNSGLLNSETNRMGTNQPQGVKMEITEKSEDLPIEKEHRKIKEVKDQTKTTKEVKEEAKAAKNAKANSHAADKKSSLSTSEKADNEDIKHPSEANNKKEGKHSKKIETPTSHKKEESPKKREDSKNEKSVQSSSAPSASPEALFDLTCKVFARKTTRFEDLGFHRVVVRVIDGERNIVVYDNNKKKKETEMLSVSLNKSSIQSDKSRKELAFVDPSSTLLYKIKLATHEDADKLRNACNKTG